MVDKIGTGYPDFVYPPYYWKINVGASGLAGNNYGAVNPLHLDTVNVLWCDGHVKSQKIDSLNKYYTGCPDRTTCNGLWNLN